MEHCVSVAVSMYNANEYASDQLAIVHNYTTIKVCICSRVALALWGAQHVTECFHFGSILIIIM